ncbi:MAG: DUF4176 domain-containing protein [Thomasclavelia ramosa]
MRELKDFLPLGSVVLLAGGSEKLMIIGYKQVELDSNSELDYSAIVIPEGYKISNRFVILIKKKLFIFF